MDKSKYPGGPTTADVLRKSLRRLVIATVLLYLAIFGMGFYVYNVARNNTQGLCAYRNDIHARVETSEKYLRKHPNGTKDIPVDVLKLSLANSKRTEKSLSSVRCPPPPGIDPPPPDKTRKGNP